VPIKLVKYGVSGGLGTAFVIGEYVDEIQGWTEPYKRTQEWIATGGFIAGLICDAMDIDAGEALGLASFPLFIRAIKKAVAHYVAGSSSGGRKRGGGKGGWSLELVEEEEEPAPFVHAIVP